MILWTIGHSDRCLADFIALLQARHITRLLDVRRHPGSRKQPQFMPDVLAAALAAHGIAYQHCPALGGRRRMANPPPTAWRNVSFQHYAAYMETREFTDALAEVTRLAASQRVALMCAEAVWWRCHRGLIADALKAQGQEVRHIMDRRDREHPYTPPARLLDGKLTYAPIDP